MRFLFGRVRGREGGKVAPRIGAQWAVDGSGGACVAAQIIFGTVCFFVNKRSREEWIF